LSCAMTSSTVGVDVGFFKCNKTFLLFCKGLEVVEAEMTQLGRID
jgi:hypothetical protein